VIYFCPEMNLIFIGVCWHLHTHGWGWSDDPTQCSSLRELATRAVDGTF
jgi:hypothetical protein